MGQVYSSFYLESCGRMIPSLRLAWAVVEAQGQPGEFGKTLSQLKIS